MQYNFGKMQVLLATKVCQMKKVPATHDMLSELVGEDRRVLNMRLSRYCRTGYLLRKFVGRTSTRAFALSKKGTRTLEQYLDRYHRGLSLNLKWNPKPVDFKDGGKPLPGLVLHDADVNEKENGS